MPHAHGDHRRHAPASRDPRAAWRRLRTADALTKAIACTVAVIAVATVAGLVAFWPGHDRAAVDPALLAAHPLRATVTGVSRAPCTGTTEADGQICVVATLRLHDAPPARPSPRGAGNAAVDPTLEETTQSATRSLHAGDDIYVLATTRDDGTSTYSFYDYRRSSSLWLLTIVFAIAVVALGRWRGLGALAGLAASLAVLVVFMLPSLLDGNNPVVVAVVAASAIAFIALYFAHGVSVATSVALIGTFASLALTAALSWVFVAAAKLSGYTDDSAFFVDTLGGRIELRGILLAGFVIGALGVLDDVTVTQVSAVAELRAHTDGSPSRIFRAALNIGRDHISSTVNTLFLAYAGAALPLLLLFSEAHQSTTSIAGREIVATEIVRSLVGSIGLVAAVPITTWLAVKALPDPNRGAA